MQRDPTATGRISVGCRVCVTTTKRKFLSHKLHKQAGLGGNLGMQKLYSTAFLSVGRHAPVQKNEEVEGLGVVIICPLSYRKDRLLAAFEYLESNTLEKFLFPNRAAKLSNPPENYVAQFVKPRQEMWKQVFAKEEYALQKL